MENKSPARAGLGKCVEHSARLSSAPQPAHCDYSAEGSIKKRIGYGTAHDSACHHTSRDAGTGSTTPATRFSRRRGQKGNCYGGGGGKDEQSLAHDRLLRISVEPNHPRRALIIMRIELQQIRTASAIVPTIPSHSLWGAVSRIPLSNISRIATPI